MKNVAILAYQNVALFELGCAVELFALSRPELTNWYNAEVITFDDDPLTSTGGVSLNVRKVATLDRYSMLIIPSWPTEKVRINSLLSKEINEFHNKSKMILSFCSGAFLLAELGILDGKEATTHWRYSDQFKSRFPQVTYVEDALYVLNDTLGCSAGSAAAIDLSLAVIRQDFGYQTAKQVARRMVMSPHRKGGQSQFVETPIQQYHSALSETLDWALENLAISLNVNTLANKANMSRRSFDRKFRDSLGCSPKEWIIAQRLDLARGLLEREHGSIELVASQSGFENATAMRHHFRKGLGVSPRQYRDQFGSLTNH